MRLLRRISAVYGVMNWAWRMGGDAARALTLCESVLAFLHRVSEDERPYSAQFGLVDMHHPDSTKPLVNLWACTATDGNPVDRIQELNKELSGARRMIRKQAREIDEGCGIVWFEYSELKPSNPGEYLVLVKNKNKAHGVFLPDVGHYEGDGEWQLNSAWERVVYWAEISNLPNKAQ